MHTGEELDHDDEHLHDDLAETPGAGDAIWHADNVELTTVGIDIGSSTSHLMFSWLHLQRQATQLSSRFVVVERRALYSSPIRLTPYAPGGLIDVAALERFVHDAYAEAGLARADVDAGAVILTGVALERANARAIADLFASEGGKFVCASAGHKLEALLAAHGSGAVALSRERGPVLNVDVGGGTTKLALCLDGQVTDTLAIVAGARLVELDQRGRVLRVEPGLGEQVQVGGVLRPADRARIAGALADRILAAANGAADPAFVLAGALPSGPPPAAVVLSGGVGELVASGSTEGFGDLGQELAAALRARSDRLPGPLAPSRERIRATVIGASQFSVQVSGNTVHVSDPALLPLRNVPVAAVSIGDGAVADAIVRATDRLDLHGSPDPVALALDWQGEPSYRNLRRIAEGVATAHRDAARHASPIVLALTADVGASLGAILREELGAAAVLAIDGLDLADLDYIDIGETLQPANVVPVVIKSLIFPTHA